MKSCRNFSQQTTRSTPLEPNLMFLCISYYLGAFGTVCCVTTLSSKRAKLVQKFVPRSRVGIFHSNAPDPPHWTLNSCFGVFRTIWVHLVPFGYLTKLGVKWAKVVQKFVPWSRVGIFHNKPLDPPHWNLTSCFYAFCTIWVHLGQFVALQHSVQNGPNWCKSSTHEVASEFFTTNAFGSLNSCFGVFCTIWMHLGPFGCLTKLSAKRAELVQKFVPRSRVIIFRNEHTWLTLLGSKLMFWCVSYYLGAIGTVWMPYKTRFKMSRSGEKVCATKSRRNFSQLTHLIHPKGL